MAQTQKELTDMMMQQALKDQYRLEKMVRLSLRVILLRKDQPYYSVAGSPNSGLCAFSEDWRDAIDKIEE